MGPPPHKHTRCHGYTTLLHPAAGALFSWIGFRCIGLRYSRAMPKRGGAPGDDRAGLAGFGRYAGPATLILSSLAEGPKHGYALTKDIATFSGVRLAPGTLYEALVRL